MNLGDSTIETIGTIEIGTISQALGDLGLL